MFITIVAVTKAYDKFCIAGMDEHGKWIRPIPRVRGQRFWEREELFNDNEFIKAGDIYEIDGNTPSRFEYPNHTEDFIVNKLKYIKTLTNNHFIRFLEDKIEDNNAFIDTVNARGRSVCLVKVEKVIDTSTVWDGKNKARMRFEGNFNLDNPLTKYKDYVVKDCKWVGLMDFGNIDFIEEAYLCIGLATPAPYDKKEYPQVIGLHTKQEIAFTENYPD